MEIGIPIRMGQGPIAPGTVPLLDHGTNSQLPRVAANEEQIEFQFAGEAKNPCSLTNLQGEKPQALILGHPLPIAAKTVKVPSTGGSKIELPIAIGAGWGKKELKAGMLPQRLPPAGALRQRSQNEQPRIALQRIVQGQNLPPLLQDHLQRIRRLLTPNRNKGPEGQELGLKHGYFQARSNSSKVRTPTPEAPLAI